MDDAAEILEIINYYILNSTAHFSNIPRDISFIQNIINTENALPKYVMQTENLIVGFGYAYPFRPEMTFDKTVKFTYWIRPGFTGNGLGKKIYSKLEKESQEMGMKNILVNISSQNKNSIKFHQKQGFHECGNFQQIASKDGEVFDILWLQKVLK